jgi:hypothetical protein
MINMNFAVDAIICHGNAWTECIDIDMYRDDDLNKWKWLAI